MERLVHIAARLVRASQRAYARKWPFLALSVLVFLLSVLFLSSLGLLPDPSAPATTLVAPARAADTPVAGAELPERIDIASIGLSAFVENPTSTDVVPLDAALLKGAVRYPTSAKLGEDGNVVLFGHSSYLPIVRNSAYKTFDGIQKLSAGATITVYSSHTAYVYAVKSIMKESANDGAIPLAVAGRELTLATCDSFGEKTDRFVVVADFVESHAISG